MPCRINLRYDQTSEGLGAQVDGVTIFAPTWVKEGLDLLSPHLNGLSFEVYDTRAQRPLEIFILDSTTLTLKQLQMISRNEEMNVTGVINRTNYEPDLTDERVILSMKDLVRQCVIVGVDETTHWGGYPDFGRTKQRELVYICDLAGLQFQQSYNSGRFVLIKEKQASGILDDLIYEKIVGEPNKSFQEVKLDESGRYLTHPCPNSGQEVFFDSEAYKKFVKMDVILAGVALNEIASSRGHLINFKFLKYGTGYFAKNFGKMLGPLILPAVIDGLEILFRDHCPSAIRSLEFPFYREDSQSLVRLEKLSSTYNLSFRFSQDDALKSTYASEDGGQKVYTATTNCGDPHAPFGNEMGFGSVDAAIAGNLKSKGNIFCPCLNKRITERFINISCGGGHGVP